MGLGVIDEKTPQQKMEEAKKRREARIRVVVTSCGVFALTKFSEKAKELEESEEEEEEEEEGKPKSWQKGGAHKKKPKTIYEVLSREEEDRPQLIVGILFYYYLFISRYRGIYVNY